MLPVSLGFFPVLINTHSRNNTNGFLRSGLILWLLRIYIGKMLKCILFMWSLSTFISSLMDMIFWQSDSMKRFSPSQQAARRSITFKRTCRLWSESSACRRSNSLWSQSTVWLVMPLIVYSWIPCLLFLWVFTKKTITKFFSVQIKILHNDCLVLFQWKIFSLWDISTILMVATQTTMHLYNSLKQLQEFWTTIILRLDYQFKYLFYMSFLDF